MYKNTINNIMIFIASTKTEDLFVMNYHKIYIKEKEFSIYIHTL